MSMHGANVTVIGRATLGTHDHRLSAEEHDHRLSSERIATAAATLRAFVDSYADLPPEDVSPADRRRLSEAAALMERACDLC